MLGSRSTKLSENTAGKKPVILCGDLNVAHQEIDLANPTSNYNSAGFTDEEREGMSNLLAEGFLDTYRHLYPDQTGAYSWWSYRAGARSRMLAGGLIILWYPKISLPLSVRQAFIRRLRDRIIAQSG